MSKRQSSHYRNVSRDLLGSREHTLGNTVWFRLFRSTKTALWGDNIAQCLYRMLEHSYQVSLKDKIQTQKGRTRMNLLFLEPRHWIGFGVQRHDAAALLSGRRRWVSPIACLNRRGKSRPHRELIPGSCSPKRVAIPMTLSRTFESHS
jgi:hypothetical protein